MKSNPVLLVDFLLQVKIIDDTFHFSRDHVEIRRGLDQLLTITNVPLKVDELSIKLTGQIVADWKPISWTDTY